MKVSSFVTHVTGLNRPNTGKEDDDDKFVICHSHVTSVQHEEMKLLQLSTFHCHFYVKGIIHCEVAVGALCLVCSV
jgi:hypothetical protein